MVIYFALFVSPEPWFGQLKQGPSYYLDSVHLLPLVCYPKSLRLRDFPYTAITSPSKYGVFRYTLAAGNSKVDLSTIMHM